MGQSWFISLMNAKFINEISKKLPSFGAAHDFSLDSFPFTGQQSDLARCVRPSGEDFGHTTFR